MASMSITRKAEKAQQHNGATRVFGKGTRFERKIASVCEKPAGHDNRGPHRAQGMTGGIAQWRGDDRD